jgi:hypothetical protein
MICIGLFFGSVVAFPILDFIVPGSGISKTLGMGNLIFISLIPVVSAILLLLRTFFKLRIHSGWHLGMWAFWILNGAMLGITGSKIVKSFSVKESISEVIPLINPGPDTLTIGYMPNPYRESMVNMFDLKYSDKRLASDDISLEIKISPDNAFHLQKSVSSRGANREEAKALAEKLNVVMQMEGNKIILPTFYELNEGELYKGQSVNYTLQVPEAKYLTFEESDGALWPFGDFDYEQTCDNTRATRTYKMVKGLMICAEITPEVEEEK